MQGLIFLLAELSEAPTPLTISPTAWPQTASPAPEQDPPDTIFFPRGLVTTAQPTSAELHQGKYTNNYFLANNYFLRTLKVLQIPNPPGKSRSPRERLFQALFPNYLG